MRNKIITGGLIVMLFAFIACSATGTHISNTNTNSSPATNSPSPVQAAATPAPRTSPDALVTELYKQHDGKHSPFFQTRDRSLVDKYFDKNLADLIWKDAVDSKGEVGALDFDPLYDAQDTQIKNFSVHQPRMEDGRAEVAVSFENFGKKEEITYLLTTEKSDWKIMDIKYKDGRTLLKTLKGE